MKATTFRLLATAAAACAIGACDRPVEDNRVIASAGSDTDPAAGPALAPGMRPVQARIAFARIEPATGQKVLGAIVMTEITEGVDVFATLEHLKPGKHGFHVHEVGDCGGMGFESAGEHFNPGGTAHGGPDEPAHHAGDLGNVVADERGHAELHIKADAATLAPDAPFSIAGRAIILHANPDDLDSQPSGDAGGRIGCGVITLVGPEPGVG